MTHDITFNRNLTSDRWADFLDVFCYRDTVSNYILSIINFILKKIEKLTKPLCKKGTVMWLHTCDERIRAGRQLAIIG